MNEELESLKNELLAALGRYGILKLYEDYWLKRADYAARSIFRIVDTDATNIAKGQISICYETADVARQAREKHEAEATAESSDAIPDVKLSAV
jgi:hypothetical protein